jgi:hypothetical protein
MDPPRLRSETGTLEGRILRSSPSFEPAPSAQDELWRRLQVATAVGVVAGAGAAAHAAATAAPEVAVKVAGKTLWLSLVKWGAVLAVGLPAAGVATHVVLAHRKGATVGAADVAASHPPGPVVAPAAVAAVAPPVEATPVPPAPTVSAVVMPAPVSAPHASHSARRPEPTLADARSALRAESALLGSARAKLAAGNYRGAFDDVTHLGAQFPHGKLAQEREVVAIDALAGLGNRAALHARASAFLSRFPESPYAAHVRESLEP